MGLVGENKANLDQPKLELGMSLAILTLDGNKGQDNLFLRCVFLKLTNME